MPSMPADKRREDRFARTGDGPDPRGARQEDQVAVVLVDAANVVGSRPDGWWRDRAGATERLLRRLADTVLTAPDGDRVTEKVAVVEGRARHVPAPEGVRVVRAGGSGDDAVVACATQLAGAGTPVVVVTADRGLRARLPAGCGVVGPGWLLERLEQEGSGAT
jgi:hypothetical protein